MIVHRYAIAGRSAHVTGLIIRLGEEAVRAVSHGDRVEVHAVRWRGDRAQQNAGIPIKLDLHDSDVVGSGCAHGDGVARDARCRCGQNNRGSGCVPRLGHRKRLTGNGHCAHARTADATV